MILERYSPEISFAPRWFTSIELDENYAFYNIPVLKSMITLPKKIKHFSVKNGINSLDKELTILYEVSDNKLEQQTIKEVFPSFPLLNQEYKLVYRY